MEMKREAWGRQTGRSARTHIRTQTLDCWFEWRLTRSTHMQRHTHKNNKNLNPYFIHTIIVKREVLMLSQRLLKHIPSEWLMPLCSTHWPPGHSRPAAQHNLLSGKRGVCVYVAVSVAPGTVCMQIFCAEGSQQGSGHSRAFNRLWERAHCSKKHRKRRDFCRLD